MYQATDIPVQAWSFEHNSAKTPAVSGKELEIPVQHAVMLQLYKHDTHVVIRFLLVTTARLSL
jgi:hypothetical protein